MTFGNGSLGFTTKPQDAATVVAANNGLSLSGTTVQLGNDVGQTTASLINNREIPMVGFSIFFNGSVPGITRNTEITGDGQILFQCTAALPTPTNLNARPFRAYTTNTGTGFSTTLLEVGKDSNSRLIIAWSDATASQIDGIGPGATLSAKGPNVLDRTLTLHGQSVVAIRAGNADSISSTINASFGNMANTFSKACIFSVAGANTAAAAVMMRNTASGTLEILAGASGTFTTTDGKTVTVTRGVITTIV